MTEDTFIDADQWSGGSKDELTFRLIVLEVLRKMRSVATVELRGGYWESRVKQVGSANYQEKFYVADTREVYSNGVDFLADILLPHFDKQMNDAEAMINADLESVPNATKEDEYRTLKARNRRKLFRELNKFLQRTRYFEAVTLEE